MASTDVGIFELTALSTPPNGACVLPIVDTTDPSDAPQGTTKKITVATLFTTPNFTTSANISGASAVAFTVGLTGSSNPAFLVDTSTGSQAAGLKVLGAIAAGTVAVSVISSGAAANLSVNAKGTGTIALGDVSTGTVDVKPNLRLTANLRFITNNVFVQGLTAAGANVNLFGTTNANPNTATRFIAATDGGGFDWSNQAQSIQYATLVAGALSITGAMSVGSVTLLTTSVALTAGATGNTPTITQGPVNGQPNKWISIVDNGTTRWIPTWS